MKALSAPPFREGLDSLYGGEETSKFHSIFGTSITSFYVGGTSLLEDGEGFHVNDKFPILSHDCAVGLDEYVDYIVEVSGGGHWWNSIHFARVESNQAHNMGKSVHSGLHHHVSETRLAQHEKNQPSLEWGVSERQFTSFLIKIYKVYFLSLLCMFLIFF